MIDNIVLILLILIYLTFIAVIHCYMNLNIKKARNIKIGKKDIPAKLLYCYGVNSPYKLFKITLMDLINKGIYTLTRREDEIIVKYDAKMEKELKLLDSEKCVIDIVNSYMEKKNDDVTMKDLDVYFSADLAYNDVVNYYYATLKKEVLTSYGVINKYLNYIGIFIITFLYSIQVLLFIDYRLKTNLILIIAVLLSFISILLSRKCNRLIDDISIKNYLIFYIISIILAFISYPMWQNNSQNDYIIVHFILGSLTLFYPLLIYTNILFLKKNRYFRNKKQESINNYIKKTKEDIKNKDVYINRDYLFMIGLNMKYNVNDIVNQLIKTNK